MDFIFLGLIAAVALAIIALECLDAAWRSGWRRGIDAGWEEGWRAGLASRPPRVTRAGRAHLRVVQ